ncbi:MAG: MBL fold metallo-hydrolase [Candidatus Moraniibacteriota bacterium]
MRSLLFRIFFLALFGTAVIGGVFAYQAWTNGRETKIVFLDVGQGDAILISQGSNQILIDGGRSGKTLLSAVARHIPFWDRTIEAVITTHPDADHIGGIPDLATMYRVPDYLSTGAASSSQVFELLKKSLGNPGLTTTIDTRRQLSITFPRGGTLRVLYPDTVSDSGASNEGSIVSRFSFGETDFLLTGDLPDEEKFLPNIGEAEVLKVSHHGSKYATSQAFLDLVRPKEAVISVGQNSYGHPDAGVIARLTDAGAIIRRTDRDGDIVYRCISEATGCTFAGVAK